ncbi:MAG: ABC transporter ATP-binding protein [Gemmatimonadales bacterium]
MSVAVRVRDITKTYPGAPPVVALAGISLDVTAGTIYGLLGPNGAGKTTTIGICTTRVCATSGTAEVAGRVLGRDDVEVRRRIGVAAQALTLDRACTVGENLYYHCRYFGMNRHDSRQRADALLERFRIADRRDALPSQLSGGLAQRAQVARAIAHHPEVLFLDEPTAGLDPQSRLALWDLVRGLRDDGITVVLTTHYMEEADRLCERVAIVDHGRILAEGTPEEIKRDAGGSSIVDVAFGGDRMAARAAVASMPGVKDVQESERGLRLVVDADGSVVPRVVSALAEYHLTDLRVTEPSLESVFIGLTGRDIRE